MATLFSTPLLLNANAPRASTVALLLKNNIYFLPLGGVVMLYATFMRFFTVEDLIFLFGYIELFVIRTDRCLRI